MRSLRAIAISLIVATFASAQTAPRRNGEVAFQITGAAVQQFDPPRDSRRNGRYSEAAVIQVECTVADHDAEVTPAMTAFLYIGSHEMRPVTFDYEGSRIVMTFHDPRWKELKGGEPMVLTSNYDDPIDHPERYVGYPRWDPKIIRER